MNLIKTEITKELEMVLDSVSKRVKNIKSIEFENLICDKLQEKGKVLRQVFVENRGDGRRGRIDIVWEYFGVQIPIELDRKTVRQKSIFKIRSFNEKLCFAITREPVSVIDYSL